MLCPTGACSETALLHDPGEQVAESKVVREEATLPGHWPGIYGCEYKNLSTIYMHTATARLAVLEGNLPAAEVSTLLFGLRLGASVMVA